MQNSSLENELEKYHIDCIYPDEFPKNLKQFEDYTPSILYYRGNKDLLMDEKIIGIVGTRNIDSYGKYITTEFSSHLSSKGWTIISGGAIGVDTYSHIGGIKRTIVVLANGLDSFYPSSNEKLFEKILDNNGLIISEKPPKTNMQKYYYLQRNRIVALLSKKIFIPQAPFRSGAMNTAAWAIKFQRDIFCPPSNLNSPLNYGTNKMLFSKEAELVLDPQDIIDYDNFCEPSLQYKLSQLKEIEYSIYKFIKKEKDVSLDAIRNFSNIPHNQLLNILFDLENTGLILKSLLGYNTI